MMFGDEGVAPWLKDKEYGKIGICNEPLWAADPPLALLPETALDVILAGGAGQLLLRGGLRGLRDGSVL